jgi:hypothetical protein
MLQRRPNTFAQTILSPSFFACDKAADHTSGLAPYSGPSPFIPLPSIDCQSRRGVEFGSSDLTLPWGKSSICVSR